MPGRSMNGWPSPSFATMFQAFATLSARFVLTTAWNLNEANTRPWKQVFRSQVSPVCSSYRFGLFTSCFWRQVVSSWTDYLITMRKTLTLIQNETLVNKLCKSVCSVNWHIDPKSGADGDSVSASCSIGWMLDSAESSWASMAESSRSRSYCWPTPTSTLHGSDAKTLQKLDDIFEGRTFFRWSQTQPEEGNRHGLCVCPGRFEWSVVRELRHRSVYVKLETAPSDFVES